MLVISLAVLKTQSYFLQFFYGSDNTQLQLHILISLSFTVFYTSWHLVMVGYVFKGFLWHLQFGVTFGGLTFLWKPHKIWASGKSLSKNKFYFKRLVLGREADGLTHGKQYKFKPQNTTKSSVLSDLETQSLGKERWLTTVVTYHVNRRDFWFWFWFSSLACHSRYS